MWANGSPGATSPAKVRKVGRVASASLESVTTMSRMGCDCGPTSSHTPRVSNSRRQAATIAVARGSRLGRIASAGSATTTGTVVPSPWRIATASASPAKAPPQITMLLCSAISVVPLHPSLPDPVHRSRLTRSRLTNGSVSAALATAL